VANKEKAPIRELEECQSFVLRINKNFFYQGLCQAAYLHGIPLEDDQYDMNNMENAEGQGDNIGGTQGEAEPSLEEL